MITIQRLGDEKRKPIIAFNQFCFPTDSWKEEDWEELLKDEKAIYYALLEDERIIGNIFIYNWKGENDYVKIMNIAIHPDYRRRGLAHQLLNHAAEEMKKVEMKRFCGETRASNQNMQKVFEDCGYTLNRIEEDYYENPKESAYKYVLQLP